MKNLLDRICTATVNGHRRACLESLLHEAFPDRLVVERTAWAPGEAVAETVNYLVPFGRRTGQLILGAHHDAVPGSPGGNDNGAALVQLLVAAHRVQERVRLGATEPDVCFCFWDHEEMFGSRFMGSRTFVEAHRTDPPARAVVFDVSGIGRLYISGRDEAGLADGLATRPTPPSDNLILLGAGIPTTLICALPEAELHSPLPRTWGALHSPADTAERVESATLEAGAAFALDVIARFKAA